MPSKNHKIKVSHDKDLTKKELKNMYSAVVDAYYDVPQKALIRVANILAAAGDLPPFTPDED